MKNIFLISLVLSFIIPIIGYIFTDKYGNKNHKSKNLWND